jgi:hypothetical protein
MSDADTRAWVGPVLRAGMLADVIVSVLTESHPETRVVDRGSYLRVLAPHRCELGRARVEELLGAPFVLPGDLEKIMPSFQGAFSLTDDGAVWTAPAGKQARP